MRTFLVLTLVAFCGILAFGATYAKAQAVEDFSYNLTLSPVEATSQAHAPMTFHFTGTIQWRLGTSGSSLSWADYAADNGFDPYDDTVTVGEFQDGLPIATHDVTLGSEGSFTDTWTISSPGTYTFMATTTQWKDNGDDLDTVDVSSDPVTVSVGSAVAAEAPNTMLCYSHIGNSTPSAYRLSQASSLVAGGYFIPYAITRATANQRGIPEWARTNYGDYVLACNVDGLKATGNAVGGDGSVWGAAAVAEYNKVWSPPFSLYPIYG